VLYNARTGAYKDFGDIRNKEKVMIYVRGSECALMKKSAKNKYQSKGPKKGTL
jgi:hypothetical protein